VISGYVSEDYAPVIEIEVAGKRWPALVDTGFNGDLELPLGLKPAVNARFLGHVHSHLAGGQTIEEEAFVVEFPFDGRLCSALATFVAGPEILIGMYFLRRYRLEIDVPARSVLVQHSGE
jgi:predicted aspartyl protease